MINIIYNNEIIDTTNDINEALQLKKEYELAFHTDDIEIEINFSNASEESLKIKTNTSAQRFSDRTKNPMQLNSNRLANKMLTAQVK